MTATELQEQARFVAWLEEQGLKFTSIPNSTYTPSRYAKMKNHAEGLRKGFPDMVVIFPDGLACIEMKRSKGGRVSKHQLEWLDALDALPSVDALVCHGAAEAIEYSRKRLDRLHSPS